MIRSDWLKEKRAELATLRGISTQAVVPSSRDFSQFIASQRTDLALVPRLKRSDPFTGGSWPDLDLVQLGRELDDADVGALAVSSAALFGADGTELETVCAAVTAPVLCDDLCIDEVQIYQARLRGADAVRIPVADLGREDVEKLVDVSVSVHMTPLLEIIDPRDLEGTVLRAPACVGISRLDADGFGDVDRLIELARLVPKNIVALSVAEPRAFDDLERLRGHVDAVIVGDLLLGDPMPTDFVERVEAL